MRKLLLAAFVLAWACAAPMPAKAMPPFALAYGIKCSVCHTQVPTLNAYGRYVQRTGYASLDPHVLRTAFPIWLGEQANYSSTNTPPVPQGGNFAIHAVGAVANDWTYHFQQWVWQNNQSGDLDTFWVAYNHLLHRDGHLFAGKITSPGPSVYSMWADLSPFATPEITVGEHVYQLDGNRWGAKLNYVHKDLDLEAGWLYSNGGWSGSSDFINTDKTFVYKAAYASATKPFEVGYLGSRGSTPVSNGIDQYYTYGGYAHYDPQPIVPGALVIYQHGYDSNPGTGFTAATSTAWTTELYQTFFRPRNVELSARKEWTNDGLGNNLQSGVVDLSYAPVRYLRLYVESAMAQNATPVWNYTVWWTFPLIGGTH